LIDGAIRASGSAKEISEDADVRKHYLGEQFGIDHNDNTQSDHKQ
jgi:ABC-type lipopolysaccharide export system ATPase subunit